MLKSGKGRGWRGLNTGSYTAPTPAAPTITSVTIDDTTPELGQTLTATANGVTGYPTPSLSYQWKRGATNVGTNSATYTTVNADVGSTLTCTVTATNGNAPDASATSSATSAVVDPNVVAPAAPVIAFTSTDSDNTPEGTADLTAPQVGDVITWQRADDSGFTTNVQTYTDTLDSTEVGNLQTTGFAFGTWANGTFYNRAKVTRGGVDSAWSSTVTKTIAVPSTDLVTNSTFDANVAGFATNGGAGLAWQTGGYARVTAPSGGNFFYISQVVSGLTIGVDYRFQASILPGTLTLSDIIFAGVLGISTPNTVGGGSTKSFDFTFTATGTSHTVVGGIQQAASTGQYCDIDVISLALAP